MKKNELATFALGCFWHVQEVFDDIPGVVSTTVGYSGGDLKNPTYYDVSSGKTGHAESIEVTFDPKKTSYEKLLDVFWSNHNATTLNRQGPDIGSQYRSIIFYHNEKQKKLAQKSLKKLEKSKKYSNPIVTEIVSAKKFYEAEEYHQKYIAKTGFKTC